MHTRIGFETCRLQAVLDHSEATEREDRPLEGLVCLQAYNDFVVTIDIAGLVRQQG